MKFGIAARVAFLTTVLTLGLGFLAGYMVYAPLKDVITNRELENLRTATQRNAFNLTSTVRQQRTDVWSLAQRERGEVEGAEQDVLAVQFTRAYRRAQNGDAAARGRLAGLSKEMAKVMHHRLTGDHAPDYIAAHFLFRTKDG